MDESLVSFKNVLGKCHFGEVSNKWFQKKSVKRERVLWLGVNVSDYYMLFLKELEMTICRYNMQNLNTERIGDSFQTLVNIVEIDIEKIGDDSSVLKSILGYDKYDSVILFVSIDAVGGILGAYDARLKVVLNYVDIIRKYYDEKCLVYVSEYVPIQRNSYKVTSNELYRVGISDEYQEFRSWQVDMDILPIQLQRWNNLLRQNFNFIPINFMLSFTQNEHTLLQLACVNILYMLKMNRR